MFSVAKLNHAVLATIMPFGSGYTCLENGKPDPDAVALAMVLQSLAAMMNSTVFSEKWEN